LRHFATLILISAIALSAAIASAQELCSSLLFGESWYISEQVATNRFVTDSDIYYLRQQMHSDFSASLAKLGPDQHIVDLGAGKGIFLTDFLKSFKDISKAPQATAFAYKIDRWLPLPKFKGKLSAKEGVFELQSISTWKKADMITDTFGVISYTHDLNKTLQNIFELLNLHGELYITTTNFTATFLPTKATLQEFLETIPGLRVEGQWGSLKVTKEQENIRIPHLRFIDLKEGYPPSRTFEIIP
jgi:SAM-dependent methyltransferase